MNIIRFLAKRKKRAKRMRAIEPSIDFTKLPVDVLPIIIGELFEEYECFRPPGEICERITNLLELRTVCRSFDQEISRNLHMRIQYSNLPVRFRFWQNCTYPPNWTVCRAWNAVIASALYNSTIPILDCPPSLKYIKNEYDYRAEALRIGINVMPFGTQTIVRYVSRCLAEAQNMLDDYSISRRNEILQTLCEFLSESHAFARFQSSSPFFGYFATPGSTDIFCIGAIFGCVSFIENKAIREETKVLTGSDAFGCALSCAILSGNVEMVEFLINPKTVPYVPVDKRDIENVIASQNLRMLELLLKAWIGIKIKVKDGKGQLYLQQVDNFVNKAIDVGNAEMTQCILSCTDQNVVAKIRLNTRNERAINKRRAIRDQKAQISDWKNTCCMWRTSEYTH